MREAAAFFLAMVALTVAESACAGKRKERRSSLCGKLSTFLGVDPLSPPIVTRTFALMDLPNLQLAITEYVAEQQGTRRAIGSTSAFTELNSGLRDLMGPEHMFQQAVVGPVQYREVDVGLDEHLQCEENGIHSMVCGEVRRAIHVHSGALSTRDGPRVNTPPPAMPTATALRGRGGCGEWLRLA